MTNKINKVDSVIILGGGTSAWLCAAALAANTKNLKVTLVDKEVGNPVGVGEATLLNFEGFLNQCGFSRSEWFNEIDATFKSGILFPNWGAKGNLVWHPFLTNTVFDKGTTLYDCWSHHQEKYSITTANALYSVSLANKVDLKNTNLYAMHVDCSKLVLWLQKQLEGKIKIIKSEMVEVIREESGFVKSLKLKNGTTVNGDLFVDCTGFRALLAANPDKVDLRGRLFCDTAVAGHVPYNDVEEERIPFVISEAVDDGWIWRIPVQSRIGSGLVFNRSITDPEEAKKSLCNYWEGRITPNSLKIIDWSPYYRNNAWEYNTVAIGLASGFIEPLESTGIGIIQTGIINLCNTIKSKYWTQSDQEKHNTYVIAEYNDCVDFVNMHYAKSTIESPFWNWVRETYQPSELLNFYLDNLESKTPFLNEGKGIMFSGGNWNCWLMQMGYPVGEKNNVDSDTADILLRNWFEYQKEFLVPLSPSHTDAIKSI